VSCLKGAKNTRGKGKYRTTSIFRWHLAVCKQRYHHSGSGDDIFKARWNAFGRRHTMFKVMFFLKKIQEELCIH
jgi:hypothetical protein